MTGDHSPKCAAMHPDCLCVTCRWDAKCRAAHAHFVGREPPQICAKTACEHYEQEEKRC